jgi:cytidine deaminase
MSDELYQKARAVRENAHAPYSGFKVGAALRSESGIHIGCNVENTAYPEGVCAEGGAISSMIAAGDSEILEVLIYAEADAPVAPCGGCRQKLAEFAGPDVLVRLAGPDGIRAAMTVGELLPATFRLT